MDIIFWQVIPSHHQSGAIRRFCEIWNGEVFGIFDMEMMPERKALGWQVPDMGKMQLHFLDKEESPASFVSDFCNKHCDAIHVLSGFRGCLSVDLAWGILKNNPKAKLVSIAERPHFRGPKTILQRFWYWSFFKRNGWRFKAVLVMGSLGKKCFKQLGCPQEIIYPYMYQTNMESALGNNKAAQSSSGVRFVYLGRFCTVKGIDILLDALPKLSGNWTVDFIGSSGALEKSVQNAVNSSYSGNVRYLGSIHSDEVIQRLSNYDVCLIPSNYDGWGMVTNEALEAGIGVLVSDAAGSADLIEASGAGVVVPSGNSDAWAEAIQDVISNPKQVQQWKMLAQSYQSRISAETVGGYLADVLKYAVLGQGQRPEAPWMNKPIKQVSQPNA